MNTTKSETQGAQSLATATGPTIPEIKTTCKVQGAGSDDAVPAAKVTAPSAKAKKAAKHAGRKGAEPAAAAHDDPATVSQDATTNGAAASATVTILSGPVRPEALQEAKQPAVVVLKTRGQSPVLQMKLIALLQPHPVSIETYGGKESVADLVKDIRENGLHREPVVTKNNVILCGHRRIRALKELGKTEIQVCIFESEDEIEIQTLILGDNLSRSKTKVQIAAEAKLRLGIEKQRAAQRKNSGVAKNEVANLPPTKKEKARDVVGKELGMSGRTVDKAAKTSQAIEALKAEGKEADAAEVEAALNKGYDSGYKAAVEKGLITKTESKKSKKEKAATNTKKDATPALTPDETPPDPPEKPTATGLDSDTALERADEVLTFLRSLKETGEELTKPQRKNWEQIFDDIDECRAELSL